MKKFLQNLFRKKAERKEPKKKIVEEILELNNETDILIEIGSNLWKKIGNDLNFEILNSFEKNVILIEMLEGQVNNGGFDQYFFNSTGEFAHETISSLKEIQAHKTAELLNNAVKIFPILPIPKNMDVRRKYMENLSGKITEKWEDFDSEFYEYNENLESLLVDYVKRNKNHFE